MKMIKNRSFLIGMIILTGASHLTSCALLPKEEEFNMAPIIKEYEGTEYSKVNVKSGDVVEGEQIRCTYSASRREELSFYEDGMEIQKVHVKLGDRVKKGDVIAELRTENLDQEIENREYEIQKNKLMQKQRIEIRDLEIEKQRKVFNDTQSIKAIRDQCDAEISNLKSELKMHEVYLGDLIDQKESFSLIAGINGRVTFLAEALEGSESIMNEVICVVAEKSKPRFIADTKRANEYVDGMKVEVTVSDQVYLTEVSRPKKKGYVYFDLLDVPDMIENGDVGSVLYIIEERRDVLYLPKTAVKTMGDKNVVYYEDENGLKVAKEVVAGLTADGKTEIISGLELGEELIAK